MLRLLQNLELKISSRHTNLWHKIQYKKYLCYQCGVRFYSHKPKTQNCDRTFLNKNRAFHFKLRYYTSQIDAQKNEEPIENLKNKTTLVTGKKINVKLKTSELKRLLGLAEPEKWTLTGK